MPTIYKIYPEKYPHPVPQEVEEVGLPHLDADGEKQYINRCFDSEADAWRGLRLELQSKVRGENVKARNLKRQLQALKETLADAKKALEQFEAAFAEYEKGQQD